MAQGFYNLTDKLKEELIKDPFVNTVTYGNIFEVDLNKQTIFPLSHFIVNNVVDRGQTLLFNISLLCMDLVDESKDDVTNEFIGNDNEQDVLNTQLAVANRIGAMLKRGDLYRTKYQLDGDVSLEPFVDRFDNKVAGWTATFNVALQRFAKHVVSQSRANLTRGKKRASNGLYDSIGYDLKVHKQSFSLSFVMEEYGMFVDRGVRGSNPSLVKNGKQKAPLAPYTFRNKMPPLKAILPWVKLKKLRLRDEKGKFKKGNYRSIAFMVQRSVFAQGIRPTMFFTKPFASAFKNLPKELVESFGLDLTDFFDFTKK